MINRKRIQEIKDVVTPQEKIDEINKFLSKRSGSWRTVDHMRLIRKTIGGCCCICNEIPNKIVKYKIGKGLLLEYYCDACLHHMKDELTTND